MEKINMDRKKLQESMEIELKQDVIVPDSKQDIFQIKEQNFYAYFNKVQINNGRIELTGTVDASILYLSSGEENVGLQASISFENSIVNNQILEGMNFQYDIQIQKQEIKVVNERKISILLTLEVQYELYGVDTIEFENDFSNIEDVAVNSKMVKINSLVGSNSNLANLKEEVKIEGTDVVSDILKVTPKIMNQEVKISHNKVLTKADLEVGIVYLTKDERIVEVNEKFPMMSFIDIENVKEEDFCKTNYQLRSLVLSPNNDEENAILVQMEYEIFCKTYEEKEQEVVSDLYSLKYQLDFTKKEIETDSEGSVEVVQNVVKTEPFTANNESMIVYSVKKEDSLWEIAKKFRVKQENIIQSNELEEPYSLNPGEKIYIVR